MFKPLKLAFCITELNVGGAERALAELAARLDKTRFSVVVYSLLPRPADESASCVPRLESSGITVRFLDMKGYASFFSGLRKLRRFLEEQKPDVFLSFLFHANFLGRLAATRAGVPHVVSGIRVAEKRARWHRLLDRLTSRMVEKYVCVSESVAEFSKTITGLPPEKLVVIPNGIEISMTQRQAIRRDRVLFAGRLDRQKGVDWLLETVPFWLPKLTGWELWIVGEGAERNRWNDRLKEKAFDALRDRIHLPGWRKDIGELLATSRILVLPSRWEGMPNVVLEAMAAGLPVVTTRVEGIPELLGPSVSAQSVAFGDTERFADRILKLAEDRDLAELLGHANRRRAEEFFSIDSVVRRYEDFFVGLCRRQETGDRS